MENKTLRLRAHTVLTMCGDIFSPGEVLIQNGLIAEVGEKLSSQQGEEVLDFPNGILMPGLINAHCHLDYTCFKGLLPGNVPFGQWMKGVIPLKMKFTEEDYRRSVEQGFEMLMQSGCTSVFNIEAFPDLLRFFPQAPLRTWWLLELLDIARPPVASEALEEMLSKAILATQESLGGVGLSPHAPYTVSKNLYQTMRELRKKHGFLWTTHLAESGDEQSMFRNAKGGMYDALKGIGRDMSDCGQGTVFSQVVENLDPECLLVHMNELEEGDFARLKQSPMPIAYCPKSHAFFNHTRFPLERLQELGCNICIGTDSLASNDTLDLRAEIREAQQIYPEISAETWLKMVTVNPAQVLRLKAGTLQPGAWADIAVFPFDEKNFSNQNPYEAIIQSTEKPLALLVSGERIL